MKQGKTWIHVVGLAACLAFLISGCATTEQTKGVKGSGFLGDYSQLQKGGGDKALLYYLNPNKKFSDYNKVMIDPVTIWAKDKASFKGVPTEEVDNLAHYLYMAVKKQLEKDYTIVDRPQMGAMRFRLAFTEMEGATVPLDIATTYLPPARLISEGVKLATGTQTFVGEATIEMEIVDSVSNERLFAGVDQRAGGKDYKGSTDTWADIKQASDWWANKIRTRLNELSAE